MFSIPPLPWLSSPQQEKQKEKRRQHQLEEERRNDQILAAPSLSLSLQSGLLPPRLLGNFHDKTIGSRSRLVTDDAMEDATDDATDDAMEDANSNSNSNSHSNSNSNSHSHSNSHSNSNSSLQHQTQTQTQIQTPQTASLHYLLPQPRRTWNISKNDQTALPRIPDYYPPFDPNCTALVTDAPPSIVVVRISECLRKRSISAEYDDESVTARCMTVDRCHFEIQLYRSSHTSGCDANANANVDVGVGVGVGVGVDVDADIDANANADVDMGHANTNANVDAVVVEVRRLSSNSCTMSFHAACHKILLAAKGLDAGDDDRPDRCRNGMEFRPRKRTNLNCNRPAPIGRSSSNSNNGRTMKRPKLLISGRPSSISSNTSSLSSSSLSSSTKYYDAMDSVCETNTNTNSNSSSNSNSNENPANSDTYTAALILAESELEAAVELLQKDRWECQLLGMERLVNLTTWNICGKETSCYIGRRLLSQDQDQPGQKDSITNDTNTAMLLMKYLMHPGAEQASELVGKGNHNSNSNHYSNINSNSNHKNDRTDRMVRSFLESSALSAITPKSKSSKRHQQRSHHERSHSLFFKKKNKLVKTTRSSSADVDHRRNDHELSPDELRHEARLRSLTLRVFCNSLDNLSKTKELPQILYPVANANANANTNSHNGTFIRTKARTKKFEHNPTSFSRWVQPAFLLSLVQDLQGAGRPHSVSENAYKLGSVHEAALAARCLRLLAGYAGDTETECQVNNNNNQKKEENCQNDGKGIAILMEEVRDFLRSEPVLERLSYARSCGRATHSILEYEADRSYNRLTEDVRSC